MSENFKKFKKVIEEKDKRFWLMIFVIISTSAIFFIWISDLNNIFSSNKIAEGGGLNISVIKDNAQGDLDKTLEEFSVLMDSSADDGGASATSSVLDLIMKGVVSEKIKEEKDISAEKLDEGGRLNEEEGADELGESEENINNLKKRIEELEGKLK